MQIDWNHLLTRLKDKLELNEVQLAAFLGLSTSMLGQVRSNTRPLPGMTRIRLLDHLGYALSRDVVTSLLPSETREAVESADNRRARRRATEAACKSFLQTDVDKLAPASRKSFLDLLCAAREVDRRELCELLDVTHSELMEFERGTRPMPFWAKTGILWTLELKQLSDVISQVSPGSSP